MSTDETAKPARPTGTGRRAGRWLPLAFIATIAMLAGSIVFTSAVGASGPPGTMTSQTVNAALKGSFAGTHDNAAGTFTTTYPSWVPTTANDQLTGTITPSAAVNTALTNLNVSDCILRITTFDVKVTGAVPSPQTLNLYWQIGPLTSSLPLAFTIPPSLNIGPLTAPSTGQGNMGVTLDKIEGQVNCFTGGGAAVITNGAVKYTKNKAATLAITGYGTPPPPGSVSGTVTDNASPTPNPIPNALVEVCTINYQCTTTYTSTGPSPPIGSYSVSGLQPGPYFVIAYPPSGNTTLDVGQTGPVTVVSGGNSASNNVVLDATQPLPPGVTLSNNTNNAQGSESTEYYKLPFTIQATGCPGGTATWQIQAWNSSTAMYDTLTGPMTETPTGSGIYIATVPPVAPVHGPAVITLTINCPGGSVQTIVVSIYIDPSGTVVNQSGVPISAATVTLFDSSSLSGPWSQVPNGDTAVMSPANSNNPDTTGGQGQYGWDVVPGFYEVSASAAGCTTVTSPPLTIPPPVVDLTITLDCAVPVQVSCSSIKGTISGTITIGKCTPASKLNKSASGAAATLMSGGSLTWSPIGKTTIISSSSLTSPGQGDCKAGSTQYNDSATVTGGTSTYTQVGDPVSAALCVTGTGSVSLVKGTEVTL
jgi:hypothetical protein